jgi:uncharacterized protein YdaL
MAKMNTGQMYAEDQRLSFLRDKGIQFQDSDIERTISYLQIPTTFSNEDMDRLIRLVAPIQGEVKLKDGVAWIFLKHQPAFPLWQKGLFFLVSGAWNIYTAYHLKFMIQKTLYLLS